MAGNNFTTQEKLQIGIIVIYTEQDPLFSFQIMPVLTTFRGPVPLHPLCSSSKLKENPRKKTLATISSVQNFPRYRCRAMELGRECLKLWGYERCDELIWVKTNQLQRLIRTGRTGHWLNHGKEHCLVYKSFLHFEILCNYVHVVSLLRMNLQTQFKRVLHRFCRLAQRAKQKIWTKGWTVMCLWRR